MNKALKIVSPYTHLSGHYWNYTVDLLEALLHHTSMGSIEVISSRQSRKLAGQLESFPNWKHSMLGVNHLGTDEYRNARWGTKADNLLRNLEFYVCWNTAVKNHGNTSCHVHCIESRHRYLLNQVAKNPIQASTLCVGHYNPSIPQKHTDAYRRAFDTGRLTFIVETNSVKKSWEPLGGENVVHVPAAIPHGSGDQVDKGNARKQLGIPQDQLVCLFFGTHRAEKDYDTAIKAAKISNSKPYLLFAGSLISRNDPEKLLQRHDYNNAKSISGFISDDIVPTLFKACDVVVLPYSGDYTKGSAVLLQACQYDKPILAANTGHLRDFVTQHDCGILYESNNQMELADCYDRLADMPTQERDRLTASIAETKNQYSWDRISSAYAKIFGLCQ